MTPSGLVTVEELLSALLACLEGSKLAAYQDGGGVWTIGIGSTRDVKPGMIITPAEQQERFERDEAPLLGVLRTLPIVEAAAYGSFGFNCGRGALLRVLNRVDSIDNPKHTTDRSGKVRSGLVNRRHLEQVLIRLSKQLAGDLPGGPAPAPVT